MKAFFDEYGMVIVVVIVVSTLIGLAAYISKKGSQKMQSTYETFTQKGDAAITESGTTATSGTNH